MAENNTQITVTKLVIETQSPMAINTGQRETGFDNELVRDVNGLPMIPATAIAGVWSHLVQSQFDEATKDQWFGFTNKKDSTKCSAQASALTISHAQLLDSKGHNVANFTPKAEMEKDALLARCLQERPHHRERVSINDRGVVKEGGKFDQILLPKGVRFALTLQWTNQRDGVQDNQKDSAQVLIEEKWHELLSLWSLPTFAFGSSTRNGLGRIKIVHSEEKTFNLNEGYQVGEALKTFRLSEIVKRHELNTSLEKITPTGTVDTISLKALDNWRCGSGVELLSGEQSTEHSVNIITYSEPSIEWSVTNQASITKSKPVLCGSSIKGILAHRIAFHYRKHTEQWAETMAESDHQKWQDRPKDVDGLDALTELLGFADSDNHENSKAGSLWVEDANIDYEHTVIRHHNSIDRFTGGVRKGALFSEELLYQPRFTLRLHLATPLEELPKELQQSYEDTLQDLKLGLLPMGAGSGRGTSLVMEDEEAVA